MDLLLIRDPQGSLHSHHFQLENVLPEVLILNICYILNVSSVVTE